MTVLFLLVGVSLAMATGALVAFAWCVRDGQLDDLAAPGARILIDTGEDGAL